MSVNGKSDHKDFLEVKGQREFYLWGLIEPNTDIFVDNELYDGGLVDASLVEVQEYQTTMNFIKAFLSLGFYIPKNYLIRARGISSGESVK